MARLKIPIISHPPYYFPPGSLMVVKYQNHSYDTDLECSLSLSIVTLCPTTPTHPLPVYLHYIFSGVSSVLLSQFRHINPKSGGF